MESLSLKAADFYHHQNRMEKVKAVIKRLPKKEDQIKFFQSHDCLDEAAALMCQEGKNDPEVVY